MPSIVPRTRAPQLVVKTLDSGDWTLSEQDPDGFTMVVFYRGLHCPVCTQYVGELQEKLGDFSSRGVEVLAVSGDSEERAARSKSEWKLDDVTVGYGLSTETMRDWDLFVSRAIKDGEPDEFNEPGLFLIKPDGTIFLAAINSMPFGRPKLDDIRDALDFVAENDFPARGEARVRP